MKNTNRLLFALLAAALVFAAGCSGDSDDDTITASDLAGTTWVWSRTFTEDGESYTNTYTLKFESNEKYNLVFEGKNDGGWRKQEIKGRYTVSGSTVALYEEDADDESPMLLTYSSGQLLYDGGYLTFNKVS